MARKSADAASIASCSSSQTAAMAPTARPRAISLRPLASRDGKLEGRAAIGRPSSAVDRANASGALEAGIQHLLAAAIGEGAGAVAAPDHQGFAPRAQQRVALAHGAAGARAGDAQAARAGAGRCAVRPAPRAQAAIASATPPAARPLSTTRRPASEPDGQMRPDQPPRRGKAAATAKGSPKPRPNVFRSVPNWDSCLLVPSNPSQVDESL